MLLTQRLAEGSQWKLRCWGILGGFGKTLGGFVLSYSSFFFGSFGVDVIWFPFMPRVLK